MAIGMEKIIFLVMKIFRAKTNFIQIQNKIPAWSFS